MRIRISRVFVLGVLVFGANALPAQQPAERPTGDTSWSRAQPVKFDSDLQREFRALETQWMDAAKARDRPRLEEFLAPDYILTIAVLGKPLVHVSRTDWLDAAYKIQAYEFKDLVARSFGNGVLWLHRTTSRRRRWMDETEAATFS